MTLVFSISAFQRSHQHVLNERKPISWSLQLKQSDQLPEDGSKDTSRRALLSSSLVFPLMAGGITIIPDEAIAALPMTAGEADGLGARAQRAMQPKPPKVLRPKLNMNFAVLLMRSSYNALNDIDCVAMDQFQRDFFLIRQAEYQPYVESLGPGFVTQGDLADPYYFDFISFAQYATIAREISQDPPLVFEEQQGIDMGEDKPQKFEAVIIRRDPALTNDKLASEHSRLVGDAILARLEETFGESDSAIPRIAKGSRPDAETLLASLSQLVKLFLVNGFAWDGNVSIEKLGSGPGGSGTQFCIAFTAPATLWSGKVLKLRRADPINSFALKTATAFVAQTGYSVVSSSVKYDGNQELSYFTIR